MTNATGALIARRRTREAWVRLIPWAVGVILAASVAAHTVLRLRVTYDVQREIAALRMEIAERDRVAADVRREYGGRLDLIERNLYGDVAAALAAPPTTSTVELWQRNRDRELRDRIQRLEEWRLRGGDR